MRRRAALILATLGVAPLACRDRAQHREPTEPAGEQQPARGNRMLAEAKACEAVEPPPFDRCAAACELHHSNSCARAGDATSDRAAAQALYREACDGGSGLGCAAAGRDKEARFYLRVHCEQKHGPSCAALARLFQEGRGGPADASAAATFRRQACLHGDRAACGEAPSK